MKLAKVNERLYLAQVQADAWRGRSADQAVSFERAALWYLNQSQDALIEAVREHHGLRGFGDEVTTARELDNRRLPSAAMDQIMAWPSWWACRGQHPENLIGGLDVTAIERQCYQPWIEELAELTEQLALTYAEY